MKIDKTKVKPIDDWLLSGFSEKKLKKIQKQDLRYVNRVKKKIEKRHKHIDKVKSRISIYACPLCNTQNPIINFEITSHKYFVECDACHCCGKSTRTVKNAIIQWNKFLR